MDQKSKVTSGSRDQLVDIGAQDLKRILSDAGGRFSEMSITDVREIVEVILDHSSHENIDKLTQMPGCR